MIHPEHVTALDLIIAAALAFVVLYAIPETWRIVKEAWQLGPTDVMSEEFLAETDQRRRWRPEPHFCWYGRHPDCDTETDRLAALEARDTR